jgi:hypothetical protein
MRKISFVSAALTVLVIAITIGPTTTRAQELPPFTMENGNAALAIIPTIIPAIYQSVSPGAGDATLVLRITTLVTNSWFDAIAPYHPSAVGVYSRLGRRPPRERTDLNRNVAMFYASYRVLNSVLPQHAATWREMLVVHGLDPDVNAQPNTAAAIGNAAGNAIVAARERDGMNQLGDEGGCRYNCRPYADYLGYEPANSATELLDPSRWQPDLVSSGNGIFRSQRFVTPQMRVTRPYSYADPSVFEAPKPSRSDVANEAGYREQANEVLGVSAELSDAQKMTAELFDDKLRSLGFSALFVLLSRNLSIDEFVQYDFLANMAAFDTAIAVWREKYRWDAVRPFSAIRYLYGDQPVNAWGGPGKGAVTDLPASSWRSYIEVADHPEYPSGSASFCSAHAQVSRLFLGSDDLGWTVSIPRGTSRIEPGVTPATDIVLSWPTWTAFEQDCGTSRLWAGVHFWDSIPAGSAIGRQVGSVAYEFLQRHITGGVD